MQPEAITFFRLSDGDYCHILDDKLVFTSNKAIREVDEEKEKKKGVTKLGIAAVAFSIFLFFSRSVLVDIFVNNKMVFVIIVLIILLVFTLAYMSIMNQQLVIPRNEIISVELRKRGLGYSYFLVRYNSKGKLKTKKVKLYDEPAAEQQAVDVMREAGLLK
jgi:magnesium-transporting ATPase (P-type)